MNKRRFFELIGANSLAAGLVVMAAGLIGEIIIAISGDEATMIPLIAIGVLFAVFGIFIIAICSLNRNNTSTEAEE